MNIDNLNELLGAGDIPDIWRSSWTQSASMFDQSELHFLRDDFLVESNRFLVLPEEALEALLKAAGIMRENDCLSMLARLCSHILHKNPDIYTNRDKTQHMDLKWPLPHKAMGEYAALFPAVVLISGIQELIGYYRARSIPQNIVLDTLSDLKLWMCDYREKNGIWGFDQLQWLYNHFSGRLFRLGRLQFIAQAFGGRAAAYRSISKGQVVALSEAGVRYRSDGQVDGTNGIYDTVNSWISSFEESNGIMRGNRIHPAGYAEKAETEIPVQEWKCVLEKGSIVLDTHIPAGSALVHEECGKSFRMAVDFYDRFFPEIKYAGFTCTSWLLDPQLQHILDGNSNVVRFQREFYLCPVLSDDRQTYERVFGCEPAGAGDLPVKTSMQRAIADYVKKGNHMHHASMFYLKDDLQHWGRGYYQSDAVV